PQITQIYLLCNPWNLWISEVLHPQLAGCSALRTHPEHGWLRCKRDCDRHCRKQHLPAPRARYPPQCAATDSCPASSDIVHPCVQSSDTLRCGYDRQTTTAVTP